MLRPIREILSLYTTRNKAAGSFNCYNYETMRGVLEAAQKADKPVIIAFGENYLVNMELAEVASLARSFATKYAVNFALHLDHCQSMEIIEQAIEVGFSSVMYDGSNLPLEENLANTKEVVAMAARAGVSVEAELGSLSLGDESNEEGAEQCYTDPEQAGFFAAESGVDALAVSIGTVHGMYKGTPNIRTDILAAINEKVSIPLVLHGGSGTPEDTIKDCIRLGIGKINVNTEISSYVYSRIKDLAMRNEKMHFSALSLQAREAVTKVVQKYIALFS